jgi:hypothetical protein
MGNEVSLSPGLRCTSPNAQPILAYLIRAKNLYKTRKLSAPSYLPHQKAHNPVCHDRQMNLLSLSVASH